MPGIALVFLKPALPLPRLVVYKPRHGFLPSGQNLRSTEGCAPNKVRHHLVGEASERGLHTLSLECSKVRQDHEVVQAGSFKLVDAAAHLRGVTREDESGCLQFVIAAPLRVESAAHVPVEGFLRLCPGAAWARSDEHMSELLSPVHPISRLHLEK